MEKRKSDYFPKLRYYYFEKNDLEGLKKAINSNNEKLIEANHAHQIPSKHQRKLENFIKNISNPNLGEGID